MADVLTMACEVVSALNAELPTTDHEYGDPIHDEERIVGVEFTWCIGPPDWVRPEAPRYHTEVVECVTRDMRGLGFTSKIVTWKRGSEPIIRCFTDNGVVFEWPVDEHLRSIYDLLANGRNVKVTLTKDDGEVIHYEKAVPDRGRTTRPRSTGDERHVGVGADRAEHDGRTVRRAHREDARPTRPTGLEARQEGRVAVADEDGICETCGTPDVEHSFADFLHHLYADQGMSKDGAKRVVGRIVDRLS